MAKISTWLFFAAYLSATASSTTITEIQGSSYLSPLNGQKVEGVVGVVTAKASNGFYLLGEPSPDPRVSNGIFVFSSSSTVLNSVAVGDEVSLNGQVSEFRSASNPSYLFMTEIVSPTNITKLSSNNTYPIVILGKDRSPPTQEFSSLDTGADGFLSVPNNRTLISTSNPTLQPDKYGMDFWESLEGQVVTIPKPTGTGFQNNFGEFWVYGDWKVTGKNGRGGLTINFGPKGIPDGNPETVIIGTPLDKTKNPQTAVGVGFTDITGVVAYQFGFFYVIPFTAPQIISTPSANIPATTLTSVPNNECIITFGDYNVENMSPKSAHIPAVAKHISDFLHTPDILFLQEIQDNSGPTDDGAVDANLTLSTLADAINSASGVKYSWASVNPIDGQDGGQPGGNIRTAFFYKPEKLQLAPGSPPGGALDVTQVSGLLKPKLSFNPGRIDPLNPAWNATRKPLVAHWQTKSGRDLYTINLHLSSKGGSSSTQGDARPPVNSPIEARTAQVNSVSSFVNKLLLRNPLANIIVAGDFNEYIQTRSVYKSLLTWMTDIDEAARIPEYERYSYVFDQNAQQLDHALISPAMRLLRKVEFEHVHVNNWSPSLSARVSDHDPSVGRIRLC